MLLLCMLVNNLCKKKLTGNKIRYSIMSTLSGVCIQQYIVAFVAHRMGLPTQPSMYVHFLCKYMKQ